MIDSLAGKAAGIRRRAVIAATATLLLAACTPVMPYLPEPSKISHGQGRLWQVEGPGIETSYVFATFDRNDERVLNLPPVAEEAFSKSELVALEMFGDPYIWRELYTEENLEMSGDQTLPELIGARTYGTLVWHMERNQRRPNEKAKPWFMWYFLGGEHFGVFDYDYEVDTRADESQLEWLEGRTVAQGKKAVALQTEQEIFDIYDKMPLERQADLLKERVDRLGELGPEAQKLQFYLDGDLASLDAVWREYLSWLPPATAESLNDRRINDRNLVMVERVLLLMRERPTFAAVGYAHLPGEKGILRLLEGRGFTVTPLL
jgi:uncharacterized protein YbaP (TraB family)